MFGLNPFTFTSKPFVTQTTASSTVAVPAGKENVALHGVASSDAGKLSVPTLTAGSVNTLKAKRPAPKTPFPPEQLPTLLRMLHGNQKTKPVIVSEFAELMKSKATPVPKITVEAKLKEIDMKRVKNTYIVDAALLVRPMSCSNTLVDRDTDSQRSTGPVRHSCVKFPLGGASLSVYIIPGYSFSLSGFPAFPTCIFTRARGSEGCARLRDATVCPAVPSSSALSAEVVPHPLRSALASA